MFFQSNDYREIPFVNQDKKKSHVRSVNQFSEKYVHVPENGIIDLRSALHPKKTSGADKFYQPKSYIQLFGNEFVPNMSIIDLLFCEGPNARNIIIQSTTVS